MKMLSGPAVGTTSSDSKLADESDSLYSFSVHSRPPVIANMSRSIHLPGTLRLGMSYLYAPGQTLDLSFGVGLTPDTPNLQFSVGLPFRMSLRGSKLKKLPTK